MRPSHCHLAVLLLCWTTTAEIVWGPFFCIPVGKRTFGPGGSELRGHRSPAGRAAPWAQEDDSPPDLDGGREGQAGLRGGGAQASYPKQGYPGARPRAALTHLPHNLLSGCKALYARLS